MIQLMEREQVCLSHSLGVSQPTVGELFLLFACDSPSCQEQVWKQKHSFHGYEEREDLFLSKHHLSLQTPFLGPRLSHTHLWVTVQVETTANMRTVTL